MDNSTVYFFKNTHYEFGFWRALLGGHFMGKEESLEFIGPSFRKKNCWSELQCCSLEVVMGLDYWELLLNITYKPCLFNIKNLVHGRLLALVVLLFLAFWLLVCF